MDAAICRTCGTQNEAGASFCEGCGSPLALACPACGAAHPPGRRFCNRCGTALAGSAGPPPAPAGPPAAAELRTVSVLFVDLVGYTSLSESRDAEDVRDLLSRYFETARTIVARHGGSIEKFIGDAVMAVWGTPVAREDDAERAVRAGLELVDAVAAFGEDVGAPDLRARAGVVTGQVASVANPGEGLVVGDRVNTASRVQSTAEPGTLFVDEVTRRASSAAIAYADAGEHSVKGKTEPLRLWRALRVVAGVGGSQRAEGLQAPFSGREHELRLVKDLFHATVERGTVRLAAVTGPAGVGKSRLQQEFGHYTDGLVDTLLWHSGRCLSYGEGIAYWALSEMVRQRLDLREDAAADEAERKLGLALDRWIPDAREREFLGPRLGALLGIADSELSRAELFAGWRLFFERLADQHPVALVFEDLQWADDGLLDFIEHLLEWSSRPIFVLALARPELLGRRPGWAARPGVTTVALEPLGDEAVGTLLDGLVSDLPPAVRARIVGQAEGVPLFAIETVRALLDRGLLADGNGTLTVAGEIEDLAIPASLSSLLTARLDGLEPEERRLVKDLAVMSGSFPRATVSALTELDDARLDGLLDALVQKQVLTVRADPLSPERGQYAFAQTLLRTVAYELLSRRERKPRHLAIAAHLRRAFSNDGEEVAEVVAGHLLDAYRAATGDPDAEELRADALAALRRSAQRARSLGAPEASERTLRTAMELAGDEAERAELAEQAGEAAFAAGRYEIALAHFESAAAAHEAAGRVHEAARAAGGVGRMLTLLARDEEAIERLRAALDVLEGEGVSEDVAILSTELGVSLFFSGQPEAAVEPLERGLVLAQRLGLREQIPHAMHRFALARSVTGRQAEARALYEEAILLAERVGRSDDMLAAQCNSSDLMVRFDEPGALERSLAALATARRLGNRGFESVSAANAMIVWTHTGRWGEIDRLAAELTPADGSDRPDAEFVHMTQIEPALLRGDVADARRRLECSDAFSQSQLGESRQLHDTARGLLLAAEGDVEGGLGVLVDALQRSDESFGPSNEPARMGWGHAIDLALELGKLDEAAALLSALDGVPAGVIPPVRQAQWRRGKANLAAARGEQGEVEAGLRAALEHFEALGYVYWAACTQVDLAAWLIERDRAGEAWPVLDEAETTFAGLDARPALERAQRVRQQAPARA
jgi:class 3 adenylate cyclase/tetratricopeptide (TPR) repeat protein